MPALGTNRSPELGEVLAEVIDKAVGEVFVALPGRIEKYDSATQKADVLPLIKNPYTTEDGEILTEDLPVISGVPIVFPRGGGYFLSFPMKKGDDVTLLFMDHSLDNYMSSSGSVVTDPEDLRNHDLSDAVALPGLYPFKRALTDAVGSDAVLGKEKGTQIHIKDGGTVEVTSNAAPVALDFVAMSAKIDALWAGLVASLGTVTITPGDGGATLASTLATKIAALPTYQATSSTNLKAD